MPDAITSAFVEIVPDFQGFRRKANSEMSGILGSAGDEGGRRAGQGVGGGILGGIKGVGGPILGAIAALGIGTIVGEAIGKGIRFGLDGVSLASDLNESFNAVKVTYGADIAADLEKLAKVAPKNLRVTQKAFNESATRFSAFAKTIVGPGGDVVGFIEELTGRGADFASVYNLDVADALQVFQSGLAGETEPLKRFGIDLSAASVEAFAYANGIGTAGKELTETEKTQARYGALLQQTSAVQGDAKATGGELAAQQRDLAVSFEEAQTKLGSALLPAFSGLVSYANTSIIPALDGFIARVGPDLAAAMETAGPKLEVLAGKLSPLVDEFSDGAVDAIPGFIDALDGILTETPKWVDAFTRVDQAVIDANEQYNFFQQDVADSAAPFRDALGGVYTEFRNFMLDIDGIFVGGPERFREAGRSSGASFALGLTDSTQLAAEAADRVALAAVNRARKSLKIASPSKVFLQIGQYTGEGYALGLLNSQRSVESATSSMLTIPGVNVSRVTAGRLPESSFGTPSSEAGSPQVSLAGATFQATIDGHPFTMLVQEQIAANDRQGRRIISSGKKV